MIHFGSGFDGRVELVELVGHGKNEVPGGSHDVLLVVGAMFLEPFASVVLVEVPEEPGGLGRETLE